MQGSLGANRRSARALIASAGTCRPCLLSRNNGFACYLGDCLLKRPIPLCRRVARQQLTNVVGRALGLSTSELTVVRTLLLGQSISPAATADNGIQRSRSAFRGVPPNRSVQNDVQLQAVNELDTVSSVLAARFASLDANLRSIDSQLQTIASLCRRMAALRQPPSERLLAAFASTTAARDTANELGVIGSKSLGTVTFGTDHTSSTFCTPDNDVGVRGTWRLRTADDLDRHLGCPGVGDAVVSQVLRNPEGQRQLLRALMAAAAAELRQCAQRLPAPSPGPAPAAMDVAETPCQAPGEGCGGARPGTACRAECTASAGSGSVVHEHDPCAAGPSGSTPAAADPAAAAAADGAAEVREQIAKALAALREVYDAAEPCGGAALSPELAARGLAAIRACVATAAATGGGWQSSGVVATVMSIAAAPGAAAVKPLDAATSPGPGAAQTPGPVSSPVLPAGSRRGPGDHGAERQGCTESAAASLSPGGTTGARVVRGGYLGGGTFVRPSGFPPVATSAAPAPAAYASAATAGGGSSAAVTGGPEAIMASVAAAAAAAPVPASTVAVPEVPCAVGFPASEPSSHDPSSSRSQPPEAAFTAGVAGLTGTSGVGSTRGPAGSSDAGSTPAPSATKDASTATTLRPQRTAEALRAPQPLAHGPELPQPMCNADATAASARPEGSGGWALAATAARCGPTPPDCSPLLPPSWRVALQLAEILAEKAAAAADTAVVLESTHCTASHGVPEEPVGTRASSAAAAPLQPLSPEHERAGVVPALLLLAGCGMRQELYVGLAGWEDEEGGKGEADPMATLAVAVAGGGGGSSASSNRNSLHVGAAAGASTGGAVADAAAAAGRRGAAAAGLAAKGSGGCAAEWGLGRQRRLRLLALLPGAPSVPETAEAVSSLMGAARAVSLALAMTGWAHNSSRFDHHHHLHHYDHQALVALAKQNPDSAGSSAVAGSRSSSSSCKPKGNQDSRRSASSSSSRQGAAHAPFLNGGGRLYGNDASGGVGGGASSTLRVIATVVALLNDASSRDPWVSGVREAAQTGKLPPPGPFRPDARSSVDVNGVGVDGLCCGGRCCKQQHQQQAATSLNAAAAPKFTAAGGGISRGSGWPATSCLEACGWEPASGWGWEGAEPPEIEFEYFVVVPRRQN